MTQPVSLRRRLMRELLPSLALIWLVSGAFILIRAWNELEESYIDQIEHVAETLAQLLDARAITPEAAIETVRARRDRNIFVLVERDGAPVLRSARAPREGETGEDRYYLAEAQAQGGTLTVIAGIEREEVRQLATAIVGGTVLPMTAGLIGMGALLFFAISRATVPLERLRNQIETRRPDSLSPVTTEDLPSELTPVAEALNALLARLSQAIETERRFVADASHELRTPLAAIRAQVESIDRSRLDPETGQALDMVLRGVERSTRLAQQLLRLARAEALDAGGAQTLPLDAQVTAIVSDLFPLAVQRGSEVALDCAPAEVTARLEDIEMLVGNLVENAIHHGGTAEGHQGEILVSCGGGAHAWLRVEDAGPGIAQEGQGVLFERFRRGAGARPEGAGLGLAIVAAVAARLGAEVQLGRSQTLGGLSAEVRFPDRRESTA